MNSTTNASGIQFGADDSWHLNLSDDTILTGSVSNQNNDSAMDTGESTNNESEMMDVDQNESFGHVPNSHRSANAWIAAAQYNNPRGTNTLVII